MEWDPCALPKVALVLPIGFAMEAPHDQVMVLIVPGIPAGDILSQTAVHSKYLVHTIPHLISIMDHDPRLVVPCTGYMVGQEMCVPLPYYTFYIIILQSTVLTITSKP